MSAAVCQDTSDPGYFGTGAEVSARHFGTSAEVSGHIRSSAELSYGHLWKILVSYGQWFAF